MLFDLDGTLADTHGLINKCYDHAIRTHLGQPSVREIWEARVGLPLEDVLYATFEHYGKPRPSDSEMETIKQSYRAHMRENDDMVTLFGGVRELVEAARASGLKLGVVTTKHQVMARRHLRLVGLGDFFDSVVCGDMCARYKPHPEPFEMALDLMNVSADETAMVGDSRHDINGAKGVGVYSIAACWGTDNRQALMEAGPEFIAERPDDIIKFINNITAR